MILAGTSRGVFTINGDATHTLQSRGVRDLTCIDGVTYAGTGAGLFRSTDAGNNWTSAGLEERGVWQVRASATGQLFASTQPAGLFTSDDGEHWHEIESFARHPEAANWCIPVDPPLPGAARALVIDQADPNRIWVGIEVGGVMASEDGGESWQLCLPGDNPDLHNLCARPDDPGVLFASTGYGRLDGIAEMVEGNAGVFRSDDGGATWTYAWRGITPRYSRPMCIDARAPFALTVASAPTAFSNYKEDNGAGAMLYRSTDGGESWRSLCDDAHSPSRANFHGLTTDAEHPGGVLVGTDTGELWRVSDAAEWQLLADGLPPVLAVASA